MAWNDLPRNQQLAVLILVPVAVIGVFGYMAMGALEELGPDPALDAVSFVQSDDRKSLYAELEELDQEIKQLKVKVKQAPKVAARLKALEQTERELEAAIPSEKEVAEMRFWLEDAATAIDPKLGELKLGPVRVKEEGTSGRRKKKTEFTTITWDMTFEGDLNAFLFYLNTIEDPDKAPRFMEL
ncbi:MAG: hypothetical protein ACOCZK_01255 [Planctomycetota bacterium]